MPAVVKDKAWVHASPLLPVRGDGVDGQRIQPEGILAKVHPSHSCVTCGGFVGCTRCGSVHLVVPRRGTHSVLWRECRGMCAKGALRPVQHLAAGKHPRSEAMPWPNGELWPMPRRLQQ